MVVTVIELEIFKQAKPQRFGYFLFCYSHSIAESFNFLFCCFCRSQNKR
uniref:Uncharacterized protein n=1 Tax=Rhizophora mucronata TaxID=61149 RepID=A0A2P2N0J9_RHIMU